MRKIDADHLLSRLGKPANKAELIIYEACINFINEEETIDESITWIPSDKDKKTRYCHSISHGFRCSKCGQWEELKSRYCKGCGGHFDGGIEKINDDVRRFKKWQSLKE